MNEPIRLKQVFCKIQSGVWGDEADGVDDVICIRVADFNRDNFTVSDAKLTLRSVVIKDRKPRLLQKGDLIIEKSGGGEKQPVGAVAYFDKDYEAITSNFMAFLRPKPQYNGRFLSYVFSSLYDLRINTKSIKQTTGIQNIDLESYLNESFSFPPFPIQKTIAAYLDKETSRIDELIAKKERQIELLQEKRQAIITRAVTKGLDPKAKMVDSGVEWIGEIPEGWEILKIKHATSILRGKFSHRPRNDPAFYDGDYPFIQTGDVANSDIYIKNWSQTLNENGFSVSKEFPRGTLVMTIAANIGDVAILDFTACFPDSIVGFIPQKRANLKFLFWLFKRMKGEFLLEAPVNTQGNLNIERVGTMLIPVPPIDKQLRIVYFIEKQIGEISHTVEVIGGSIALLREYRSSLITAAVSGQIDVAKMEAAG